MPDSYNEYVEKALENTAPGLDPAAKPNTTLREPTEDGWYAYDGGRQTMLFRLTRGQWYVINDVGESTPCDWGYIEQALSVWDLMRILVPEP